MASITATATCLSTEDMRSLLNHVNNHLKENGHATTTTFKLGRILKDSNKMCKSLSYLSQPMQIGSIVKLLITPTPSPNPMPVPSVKPSRSEKTVKSVSSQKHVKSNKPAKFHKSVKSESINVRKQTKTVTMTHKKKYNRSASSSNSEIVTSCCGSTTTNTFDQISREDYEAYEERLFLESIAGDRDWVFESETDLSDSDNSSDTNDADYSILGSDLELLVNSPTWIKSEVMIPTEPIDPQTVICSRRDKCNIRHININGKSACIYKH